MYLRAAAGVKFSFYVCARGRAHAPLLQLDLGVVRAGLRGDELLEVADGVVRAALDAHCNIESVPKG